MPAHSFLIVWICTLPLALFRNFQYVTPLVCAIIAFLLIGVENIGVQVCPPVPAAQLLTLYHCAEFGSHVPSGSSCQLFISGLLLRVLVSSRPCTPKTRSGRLVGSTP